jgi:hypothetical protein
MLNPDVRRHLEGTQVAHLATVLADGSPHTVPLTAADNPFEPIMIRGRVVEWLEGDEAWEIVDRIAAKYIGGPYPRDEVRVVAVVEPERQSVGMG